jgi:hypothetical protein
MERFNLKKLNEVEGKEQYCVEISNRFTALENLETEVDVKVIYSSIQVSNVLVLTVNCKLINFVFQIFPLFIPEMSAGFASCIVHIVPI